MNTQPLELIPDIETLEDNDTAVLLHHGFTEDEIISLIWLQQWYQHGGSDRIEVLRNLEFVKLLLVNGKIKH